MHRFLDFQLRKEIKLWPLALNQTFRGVAVSLLGLFSSIYIYKTIFQLTGQQKLAFLAVFTYFLVLYVFKFIGNLFAEEISLRLGLKKPMYLGLISFAVCFLLMYFSSSLVWLIFLAAPFWGMATGFYWFGSHGLMVKLGREGHFGRESGLVSLVTTLPLIGVPFLGGILIRLVGYQALFGSALIFILLSALALSRIKEVKTRHDTNFIEVFKLFKTHKGPLSGYMGDNIAASTYSIVIPLYLFLILEKELSLGGFFSLSMVVVALLNIIIGRWADVRGNRGLVVYGSIVQAFVWLARIFTRNIGAFFSLDIADRITDTMVAIPLQVSTYQKALDGHSTGRAVLFREISYTIGGFITCLILIIWVILGIELKWFFLVSVVASFLPILSVKKVRGFKWLKK
ncbi:MFS transporter [Patescibacteria group bacterium]